MDKYEKIRYWVEDLPASIIASEAKQSRIPDKSIPPENSWNFVIFEEK